MRKLMLTAALLAVTTSVASAQADTTKKAPAGPPTIEGNWSGSIETPNGGMNVLAAIKKAPGGYSGIISGLEGNVPLREITVSGDTVSFVATMSAQGQSFDVWYSFLFKEGGLDGKLDANVGGQSMSFPLFLKKTP